MRIKDMDGIDIEILTDTKRIGDDGSILQARGIRLNGQEIAALEGAEFSLHTALGKAGVMQATFTVMVKSVDFKDRTPQ
jgi:hypothetical protein